LKECRLIFETKYYRESKNIFPRGGTSGTSQEDKEERGYKVATPNQPKGTKGSGEAGKNEVEIKFHRRSRATRKKKTWEATCAEDRGKRDKTKAGCVPKMNGGP